MPTSQVSLLLILGISFLLLVTGKWGEKILMYMSTWVTKALWKNDSGKNINKRHVIMVFIPFMIGFVTNCSLQVTDLRDSHYPRYFFVSSRTTHGKYLIHESKSYTIPFIHYCGRKNMVLLSSNNLKLKLKLKFKFSWSVAFGIELF
jgi:hypothetical protein